MTSTRAALRSSLVMAATVALCTPQFVLAGDGFYAGIHGGWNKVARQDFRVFNDPGGVPDDTLVTSTHYDDGGLYGAVLGWTFDLGMDWGLFSMKVRPELEYSMRLNDQDRSNDLLFGNFSDGAGHVRYKSLIPNLWFDFNAGGKLRPYFGGGYGWGEILVNDLNYGGTRSAQNGDHENGDVFQVGVGLAYDVTPKFTMSLDWRHQNSEVFEFNFVDQSQTRTINEDYRSEALVLSMRYAPFHREPEPAPTPAPPAPVQVVEPTGPVDSDGDGIPDDLDKCPDTPPGVKVDEDGCPLPECKDPVPGQPVNLDGCAEGDVIVLRGVTFEFDKVTLTKEAEVILDAVGEALNRSRVIEVELRGHTDSIGSDAYNQSLSEGRALSVKNYLANLGVDPGRMTPLGFGESQPIADNGSAEGRALNRRVELKVTAGRALVAPIEPTVGPDIGASEPPSVRN